MNASEAPLDHGNGQYQGQARVPKVILTMTTPVLNAILDRRGLHRGEAKFPEAILMMA